MSQRVIRHPGRLRNLLRCLWCLYLIALGYWWAGLLGSAAMCLLVRICDFAPRHRAWRSVLLEPSDVNTYWQCQLALWIKLDETTFLIFVDEVSAIHWSRLRRFLKLYT